MKFYKYVKENFDGYVSRINPGNLKEENEYFDMLRKFCADKLSMPRPDAMILRLLKKIFQKVWLKVKGF